MLRGVSLVLVLMLALSVIVMLYLFVRHFHHRWKWQDKVNENRLRKAMLDEFEIQYEVDGQGFVRPVSKAERQSRGLP